MEETAKEIAEISETPAEIAGKDVQGAKEVPNDNDITRETTTNTANRGDEPDSRAATLENLDILSQEAAVDEFLAGDERGDFCDEIMVPNIEEGIDFKQENVLTDVAMTETDFPEIVAPRRAVRRRRVPFTRTWRYRFVRSLKRRGMRW